MIFSFSLYLYILGYLSLSYWIMTVFNSAKFEDAVKLRNSEVTSLFL